MDESLLHRLPLHRPPNSSGGSVKGAQRLALRIEQLIDGKGLSPGDRLGTKQELCEFGGMAMPGVNEALRLLEGRGRVRVRSGPGGGVFVAEPSPTVKLGQSTLSVDGDPHSIEDAIVLRDALEPLIAADAACARSEQDILELRAWIAEMRSSINDEASYGEANFRLHVRIAQISHNTFVRSVYAVVMDYLSERIRSVAVPSLPSYRAQRQRLHEDLVDAIANGDVILAQRLARKHAHPRRESGAK